MNKNYFEIFKRYRTRKYNRDLEKLQKDFASRGLAYSGMREKAQQWLKEDFDDEVKMKQEEAAIGEEESKQRRANILSIVILAVLAFATFIGTVYYAEKNFNEQYRPYIVFEQESTDFDYLIGADEKDNIINDNIAVISTRLSNTGLVPAKFKISEKTNGIYNEVQWTPRSAEEGILAPKQNVLLSWQVEWDTNSQLFSDWSKKTKQILPIGEVTIKIDYSRINDAETKYYTLLGNKVVLDEKKSIDKNTGITSGKFDWFIKEMN